MVATAGIAPAKPRGRRIYSALELLLSHVAKKLVERAGIAPAAHCLQGSLVARNMPAQFWQAELVLPQSHKVLETSLRKLRSALERVNGIAVCFELWGRKRRCN